MNKENLFISHFKSSLNGDDGAFLDGVVYSTDSFFEDIHFKKDWMSYQEIATKAMLVNISDAIAMNARARYALLNVAMPESMNEEDISDLAQGFLQTASLYGIEIIGGDTIANAKLDISVTIISYTQNPLYRFGMQEGDLLAYTGSLGSSKKDLQILMDGGVICGESKFIRPILAPEFMLHVREYLHCGLDISDGLFFELERLSKVNNMGIELTSMVDQDIGCSGEEYELLFSFDPKHLDTINQIASQHNIALNICAKASKQYPLFVCPCKPHHF